ncbi:hypothetical protein NDU88_002434 [Pleurodeles waltl]|uniref:Uncharacterized protein n=1 Tax=Pleurodeles waltl TaxID=8319 RepID=A0AAV7U9B1_PLEWA|nr:hypothetical protein NDU88_002434 [Pleurodeles waltl]
MQGPGSRGSRRHLGIWASGRRCPRHSLMFNAIKRNSLLDMSAFRQRMVLYSVFQQRHSAVFRFLPNDPRCGIAAGNFLRRICTDDFLCPKMVSAHLGPLATEKPFVYSFSVQINPNEYGFLETDTGDNGNERTGEGRRTPPFSPHF